jgi:hypothetical protein
MGDRLPHSNLSTPEKCIGVIVALTALIGAVTGVWALMAKQPLDEHTEVAKSFLGQIDSASARADSREVTRVRLLYEEWEQHWRNERVIVALVRPLQQLESTQLSPSDTQRLAQLVGGKAVTHTAASAAALGAAYIALNDYRNAATQLSGVTSDPKTLVLKAVAFDGLSKDTSDATLKAQYFDTARQSLDKGIAGSRLTGEYQTVQRFVEASPGLVELREAGLQHRGS